VDNTYQYPSDIQYKKAMNCRATLQGYMYRKLAPNPQTPFTQRNRLSNRLSNRFDNRLNACLHDAAGLTTGWTTGSIVYANIQPVVQPVVQPLVRFDNRGSTTGCIV